MPVFTYKGTNRAGTAVAGEMTANSKTELQSLLRRQQITPTKMSEKGKEFNLPTFGGGVNAKELAMFTRQFSVMIDAGLPLVQCLEILASQQENKTFQKVLTGTRSAVEGGSNLSTAMKQYPKVFDPLYSNMVEAGETGGILDTILQRLSTYIEKNVKLKAAVKSALIYPIGVLTIAGGVITLLLWKVVPIFATLFAGLGVDLPLPTKIVIGLSHFVGSIFGFLILVGLVASIFGLKIWYGTPQGPLCHRHDHPEVAGARYPDAEDRGRALYAHLGHADLQRRADPGRPGHYRQDFRKRGRRKGPEPGPQVPGRRQIAHRTLEGIRSVPGHGHADDRGRRTDRRDGCHVAEDRGLLRRRSGRGREGPPDRSRTDHDRFPRRGGRRRGHFHVLAAVLADRQTQQAH